MIGRFLDSFLPHVDSLSVVRAIGNQTPDKSLDIAKERGCLTGEYLNAEGNDWPHIDNFAKAVLDTMNGKIWKDDSQITSLYVSKQWAAKGEDGYFTLEVSN